MRQMAHELIPGSESVLSAQTIWWHVPASSSAGFCGELSHHTSQPAGILPKQPQEEVHPRFSFIKGSLTSPGCHLAKLGWKEALGKGYLQVWESGVGR